MTPSAHRTDPRRLTSIAAAAEFADLSTRTIRRYVAEGRLVGYRVGPRLIKIDLNELDALARPVPAAEQTVGAPRVSDRYRRVTREVDSDEHPDAATAAVTEAAEGP